MSRHKNIPNIVLTQKRLRKPLRNLYSGPYRIVYLCPVVACSQPLVRRDGLIVCSADPWHYTQEVIEKVENNLT
jgi:uncharacterized Zn finger protein (UPF0148 family)